MTHLERLFAALWISEVWYAGEKWRFKKKCLHYKARGIIAFDRVLTGRVVMEIE